jgi:hypothetical protein
MHGATIKIITEFLVQKKKCQHKMQGIKNVLSVLTGNLAYSPKNMDVYFLVLE